MKSVRFVNDACLGVVISGLELMDVKGLDVMEIRSASDIRFCDERGDAVVGKKIADEFLVCVLASLDVALDDPNGFNSHSRFVR